MPNGGFEAGRSGFEVMSWSDYRADPPQPVVTIDATSPFEGTSALKIDNTASDVFIEYHAVAVPVPADRKLTYSVSLRADRAANVRLYFLNLDQDATTREKTWFGTGKFPVRVGTSWSRHSFTATIPEPHRRVVVQLEIQDPITLWMDAVQVEPGDAATDYAPASSVEGFIELDDHVFVRSDDPTDTRFLTGRIVVRNNEANAKTVTLRRDGNASEVSLQPLETKTISFTRRLTRYGVFALDGELVDGEETISLLGERYGVVGEMPAARAGFFLGVNAANGVETLNHILGTPTARLAGRPVWHSNGRVTPARHYRNVRLAGIRKIRMHDNCVYWNDLQPEPDRWNWELLDAMVDGAGDAGLETMFVLGNGGVLRSATPPDPLADWFVRQNSTIGPVTMTNYEEIRPALDDWTNYVFSIARHCGTRLSDYEVMNEPNLVMSDPTNYVAYLKSAYACVKAGNPAATVVGICATGDFGAQALDYVSKVGDLGGFGFFDILSFHPYNAALDYSPLRAERQIDSVRALADAYRRDIPVLQDEVYFLTDVTWNKPNFDLARDWPAGNLVRRYAIDLAGGLAGSMPITFDQMRDTDVAHAGQESAARFSWHFVPNERFVVSNMAGRHFEGATCLGKPALDARLNGFVFRAAAGYEFATLWALQPGRAAATVLPGDLVARDVCGNALDETPFILTETPVYLFGTDLLRKIAALDFDFGVSVSDDPSVRVTGLAADPADGTVTVSYALTNAPAIVTVDFKDGATSLGNEQTRFLTGDVNRKVTASAGRIVWNARRAAPERTFAALNAEVRAWSPARPPDYLAVDLIDGSLRYYESTNALPGGIDSDLWRTDRLLLKWVPIDTENGSTFALRGSTHDVTLTKRYYLGVFVVSQRQWERVWMHESASSFATRRPSPFKNESCYGVRVAHKVPKGSIRGGEKGCRWPESSEADDESFIGLLRKLTGDTHFDLPTEAQWEFAGRAGTTTRRFWGDSSDPGVHTNYCRSLDFGYGKPTAATCGLSEGLARVGGFLPNGWGFYDFFGGAWEHVLDWPEQTLSSGTERDRTGPSRSGTETKTATRGGYSGNAFSDWFYSFNGGGAMTAQDSDNDWSGSFRVCYRVDEFEKEDY